MTIIGPSYTATEIYELEMKSKLYFQPFKVDADRGLESIQVRLLSRSGYYSVNLLSNTDFTLNPFLPTTPQRWQAIGNYVDITHYRPTWSANQIAIQSMGPNNYNNYWEWQAIWPGMRTPVTGLDGKRMRLEAGWNVEVSFGMVGSAHYPGKTAVIKAFNSDQSETFSTTVTIPQSSALTQYVLNFVPTKPWRGVHIEITFSEAIPSAQPVLIKNASVRYRIGTLNGLVKMAVYQDANGRPGAQIAAATTTKIISTDLTGTAADYVFTFPANVFLKAGEIYHFAVLPDSTEIGNWIANTVDRKDNTLFAIGNPRDSTSTKSLNTWLYGVGWDTTFVGRGSLNYQINYTDTVPPSGANPVAVLWDCDCVVQYGRVTKLIADSENLLDVVAGSVSRKRIEIASAAQPGIGRWQSEWILQGHTLPIPQGTQLLWFNTQTNRFGGEWYMNGLLATRMEQIDGLNQPYAFDNGFNSGSPVIGVQPGQNGLAMDFLGWQAAGMYAATGGAVGIELNLPYRSQVYLNYRFLIFGTNQESFQVFVDGIPEGVEEFGVGAGDIAHDGKIMSFIPTNGNAYNVGWLLHDILEPGHHWVTLAFWGNNAQIWFGNFNTNDISGFCEVIRVP